MSVNVCLCICLSAVLSVCCMHVCLRVHLSACLSICHCLSVSLSVCHRAHAYTTVCVLPWRIYYPSSNERTSVYSVNHALCMSACMCARVYTCMRGNTCTNPFMYAFTLDRVGEDKEMNISLMRTMEQFFHCHFRLRRNTDLEVTNTERKKQTDR